MKILIAILAGILLALPLQAEQKMQLGQWDVHYIVFGTSFLTPQVAKEYGIVRSRYRALVNISVLNTRDQQAQNVAISGDARNLLGKRIPLVFKQVKEGKAIYYLAELPFDDKDTYRFDILLRQGNQQQRLKFQQKLYVD